jgi:hypothetical protein
LKVIIAEHPQRPTHLFWRPPDKRERRPGVNDQVASEELRRKSTLDELLGDLWMIGHRVGVVTDHISRVMVGILGLQELEDHTLVYIVLPPLARIHRAVIKSLVGDPLLVTDVEPAKSTD